MTSVASRCKRMSPRLTAWMLAFTVLATTGRLAAQPASERHDRIDNLLESLIESELERREFGAPNMLEARPQPTAISRQDETKLRRLLDDFSAETTKLSYQIDDYGRQVPALRNHLSDVLKVRARSGVMAQRIGRVDINRELRPEFETLDRDWRRIAHELSQIIDLPRVIKQQITTLDGLNREIATVLSIKPQLDRIELIRQASALTADLENLLEDIDIELGGDPNSATLLINGRKAHQQAIGLIQNIAREAGYDSIVGEYKRFKDLWYPLATQLRPYENRYIERSVRRIRTVDSTLHSLLWLEKKIDNQQLLHVTSVLTKDADEFFTRTPLKLLVNLPNGYEVIPVADEFYGVLQNFADVVTRGESFESIVDAFQYVDDSGEQFVTLFQQINSRSALSVLSEIERSLDSLRMALKIENTTNLQPAIELAATLEVLADRLDIDTNNWLNRRRESFRVDALKATAGFAQATHQLHEGLVNGVEIEQLRREVNDLFSRWRTVYGYISRCDSEDRPILARGAAKITPGLVELRTLLEE